MQQFSLLISRIRMPLLMAGVWGVLLRSILDLPATPTYVVLAVFCVGLVLQKVVSPPEMSSIDIGSPVEGRWQIYNSPTSKVPSHGVHGWAQTFAVDFVFDPENCSRPGYGCGKSIRPPGDYPGFGQPILSPISGRVVSVSQGLRDHGSRDSTLGRLLMVFEGLREFGGPSLLVGNHVILRHPDGWYILLAHLKQRSVSVSTGDLVDVGDKIASCGNSGNSSEPHLHMQVMDRASLWVAVPIPCTINAEPLPGTGDWLEVLPSASLNPDIARSG